MYCFKNIIFSSAFSSLLKFDCLFLISCSPTLKQQSSIIWWSNTCLNFCAAYFNATPNAISAISYRFLDSLDDWTGVHIVIKADTAQKAKLNGKLFSSPSAEVGEFC